jgi:hypothetical protein
MLYQKIEVQIPPTQQATMNVFAQKVRWRRKIWEKLMYPNYLEERHQPLFLNQQLLYTPMLSHSWQIISVDKWSLTLSFA